MRLVPRIGLPVLALLALVAALGGCGGASDEAARRLHKLELAECYVGEVEDALEGLETGIAATRREFDSAAPWVDRNQIPKWMQQQVGAIRRRLPSLENCPRYALPLAAGKQVPGVPLPPRPQGKAITHRIGPARVEPGGPVAFAQPCPNAGENGTTSIGIWNDVPHCAKVWRGGRLSFANFTWNPVLVRVGDWELWLAPAQGGTIPAAAETYLGRGAHSYRAEGGLGGTVDMIPPDCVVRPPLKPGEELCFP
jgi:hypothetical protein